MLHTAVMICALTSMASAGSASNTQRDSQLERNSNSGRLEISDGRSLRPTRLQRPERVQRGVEPSVRQGFKVTEVRHRASCRQRPRRGSRWNCCPQAACAPAPAPGDPHEVNNDCRYAILMQIGNSCYWLHLNCMTTPSYQATHQMYEPCGSNICRCNGAICEDAKAAAGVKADNPYEPIEMVMITGDKDQDDKAVNDAFSSGAHGDLRAITYGGAHEEWTIADKKDPDKQFQVQLMRINVTFTNGADPIAVWIVYQIKSSREASEKKDPDILGSKDGESIILEKKKLNDKGVNAKRDLRAILDGFIAD